MQKKYFDASNLNTLYVRDIDIKGAGKFTGNILDRILFRATVLLLSKHRNMLLLKLLVVVKLRALNFPERETHTPTLLYDDDKGTHL